MLEKSESKLGDYSDKILLYSTYIEAVVKTRTVTHTHTHTCVCVCVRARSANTFRSKLCRQETTSQTIWQDIKIYGLRKQGVRASNEFNWLIRGPGTKLILDGFLYSGRGIPYPEGHHMFPRRTLVQAGIELRYYGTFSVP